MGPKLCSLIHLAIFAWYIFTLRVNCSLEISERHPGARLYGGRWKYLTFINLVLQTVFFGFCFLTDVIQMLLAPKRVPLRLVKIRDAVFTILVFPVGMFVVMSFWSLYVFDRELVYPKFFDDIIPTWLNHALHTVIFPLLLIQLCLQHHQYHSRAKGILGLALFAMLYLSWVLWVHHASGIWVYPIMAKLSPGGLVLFFTGAGLTMAPLYLLGERLSTALWETAGTEKKKK
ncbi:androgen dependent TFPI regulating protein 1 [Conger conger]|uniref:androgen dependent TFPI regulating protein 1 n=1 Tax=Conger conger TaxID=82655 RepID=UPI002A59D3CD|nr:androgen dependent TFPI regulating protein 1 [Conger conger]